MAPKARVRREGDPHPLDAQARSARIAAAERAALRLFPGPIGQVLFRELEAFAEIGPHVGSADALMWKMIDQLLEMERGTPDGSS
jgi:hypothetical protein